MSTKKVYAMLAIVAVVGGVGAVTGITFQTAVADQGGAPNDNANGVAKGNGATSNKEFFQTCKEINTASDCAQSPSQVGKFIRERAHIVNGP